MLKIVIIGGKLQGSEVAYLGAKAGYEVVLIDKDPKAPARKLSSKFLCADITNAEWTVKDMLKSADMIIPTMENYDVLEFLVEFCEKLKISDKLAFDWEAYKISRSKKKSDELFHKNDLPSPRYYPAGCFPYIAKPSEDSGSHGVMVLETQSDMVNLFGHSTGNYIIQEFVQGPSYSVEIIGSPGNYRTYVLTEIFVDEGYDCYSAATLNNIDKDVDLMIRKLAEDIADLISLKGIMDLEVIVQSGQVKILEIDARFPSQTPIVVYHASGVNYVSELYDLFINGDFTEEQSNDGKCASLIHYYITKNSYCSMGEHIMTEGGALDYTTGITDEATVISDYSREKTEWRSTFIYSADTCCELSKKARKITGDIDRFLLVDRKAI